MNEIFDLPVNLRIKGTPAQLFHSLTQKSTAEKWLCDEMQGDWIAGGLVVWKFGDQSQEIRVKNVVTNSSLSYAWNFSGTQAETNVCIQFKVLVGETGIKLR